MEIYLFPSNPASRHMTLHPSVRVRSSLKELYILERHAHVFAIPTAFSCGDRSQIASPVMVSVQGHERSLALQCFGILAGTFPSSFHIELLH